MNTNTKKPKGLKLPSLAEWREDFRKNLKSPTTDDEALQIARELDNAAITETLLIQHRGGRAGGEDRERAERVRQHIRALRTQYPTASAPELWKRGDANELMAGDIKDIKPGRWANLVAEVAPRRTGKRRPR